MGTVEVILPARGPRQDYRNKIEIRNRIAGISFGPGSWARIANLISTSSIPSNIPDSTNVASASSFQSLGTPIAVCQDAILMLCSSACISSSASEVDGASGNDLLHYAVTSPGSCLRLERCFYDIQLCCNHSVHLSSVSALSLLSLDLLNSVCSSSLFLRGPSLEE
jgi:hypothetical protein